MHPHIHAFSHTTCKTLDLHGEFQHYTESCDRVGTVLWIYWIQCCLLQECTSNKLYFIKGVELIREGGANIKEKGALLSSFISCMCKKIVWMCLSVYVCVCVCVCLLIQFMLPKIEVMCVWWEATPTVTSLFCQFAWTANPLFFSLMTLAQNLMWGHKPIWKCHIYLFTQGQTHSHAPHLTKWHEHKNTPYTQIHTLKLNGEFLLPGVKLGGKEKVT